jgi:hypothetical protein
MPSQPIPFRKWLNADGRSASVTGAVPYVRDAAAEGWRIVESGWSVQHEDGTRGLGRAPFETEGEARAWCDANPRFRGMSRD